MRFCIFKKYLALIAIIMGQQGIYSNTSAGVDINVFVEEEVVLKWGTNNANALIYPQNHTPHENISFQLPLVLHCANNSPRGWSVSLLADNVDINNNFLFLSEDQLHQLEYVLVANDGINGSKIIKNDINVLDVNQYTMTDYRIELYPTIPGDCIKKVPSGYYFSRITAVMTGK